MSFTMYQLFHTSVFLLYVFTTSSMMSIHIPHAAGIFKKFDPGPLKYLTVWNLVVQTVFFFVCMLNDWFGTNAVNPKKIPLTRKLKDYLHAVLSFPIAMFVGVTFWSVMLVDRELVLPKALDAYLPTWLNHLMHTMIMFPTLIETIIAPRKYPKRLHGIMGEMVFMLAYLIWMHLIYYITGIWVYPIMYALPMSLRLLFFVVLFGFSVGLYIIGEALDNFIWGNEYIKHQKPNAKSK